MPRDTPRRLAFVALFGLLLSVAAAAAASAVATESSPSATNTAAAAAAAASDAATASSNSNSGLEDGKAQTPVSIPSLLSEAARIRQNRRSSRQEDGLVKHPADENGSNSNSTNEDAVGPVQQQPRARRKLGDFDEFNEIFEGARILLEDQFFSQVVIFRLNVDMYNIECFDISVGDIAVRHTVVSSQEINVFLDVTGIELRCTLDYDYEYKSVPWPVKGDGSALAVVGDSSVTASMKFSSFNFAALPPRETTVTDCASVIDVKRLDSYGSLAGDILEAFERRFYRLLGSLIQDLVCGEINELDTGFIQDLIDLVDGALDPYLQQLSADRDDPLHPEVTADFGERQILSFQETGSLIGTWFDQVLQEADALLGTVVDDPASGTNARDLGVNIFLRDNLLQNDRSFVIDMETFGFPSKLYEGHDQLTETAIYLNQVKIFGLDTFTKFEPLIAIGQHTLQNKLKWEYLTLEFDITVETKASSLPDAILVDATSQPISERINIDFGIDGADVIATLFLAIDQDKLGSMPLGPLLDTKNILPCLLSTVADVQVSGLAVNIDNIRTPTLDGFISPGIDRVVTNAVEALFEMYEGVVIRAIPNIFQITIRDIINKNIIQDYMSEPVNVQCPSTMSDRTYVDFRDLLLDPNLAQIYGGTGTEPYGDMASTVFDLVRQQLLEPESSTNNLLKLNSILIDPLTKRQSGQEGLLRFPSALLDFVKTEFDKDLVPSFISRFAIKIYNTRIDNLNTFVDPAFLLTPNRNPYILGNDLNMGPVSDKPLNFTIGLRLVIEGDEDDSALAMDNDMDLSFSADQSDLSGRFVVRVDESRMQDFPIRDVLNYHCWLATIPPPQLDADGVRVPGSESDFHLSIQDALLELRNLDFDVNFMYSTSPGVALLPDVLDLMRSTGVFRHLQNRVAGVANELMNGKWVRSLLDQWVVNAPKFCPHDPAYDESAMYNDYGLSGFPNIGELSIDTLLFAVSIGAPVAVMVLAETQRLEPPEQTNPMSAQNEWVRDDDTLDWSNMTGTLASFVETGMDELIDYFAKTTTYTDGDEERSDLGINIKIRDWLLDEENDDWLVWELDGIDFDLAEFNIDLTTIRLGGIDTFKSLDIWNVIAPQTINNTVAVDELRLELVLTWRERTSNRPREFTVNFALQDIEVSVPFFFALNTKLLGELEIGSFFDLREILPCLLSATQKLEVTQLLGTIGSIDRPVFTGLDSVSEPIVVQFTNKLFDTFVERFLSGIPQVLDDSVRKLLNGFAETLIENAECDEPIKRATTQFIDFRSFFDSDLEVYGDVPPLLRDLVDDELLAVDRKTGRPKINGVLVDPVTERQSGEEGTLSFPGTLFGAGDTSFETLGLDSVVIKAYDAAVHNLNTFGTPIQLLEPNATSGSLVDNRAVMGYEGKPLEFLVKTLVELTGDPMLEMMNDVDIVIGVDKTDLFAVLLANIEAEKLLSFPLKELMSIDCWLSLMSNGSQSEAGGIISGLGLDYIALTLESLRFGIECRNCSSTGLYSLPTILQTLEDEGIAAVLEENIVNSGLELLRDEYIQDVIDNVVIESAKTCPSSPNYISGYASDDSSTPTFPPLPYEALETIAFAAAIGVQVATVVVAESHNEFEVTDRDPLDAEQNLIVPDGKRLMNFTDFDNLIGSWADVGIDRLLRYLNRKDDAGELEINNIIRTYLLEDEDGSIGLKFEDMAAGINGMHVQLKEIRLSGLDTVTKFDALQFIGAQTVANKFSWEELKVRAVMSITTDNAASTSRSLQTEQDIVVSLDIKNIDLALSLFLAVDLDLLGSLELGSILEIKDIFPCFLTSAEAAELTQLKLSVGSIDAFTIKGFRSAALEEAVQQSSSIILDAYGQTIISSLPTVFDTTVRALLNNWMEYYLADEDNFACTRTSMEVADDSYMDLRDLLLKPSGSAALDGSGDSRYGDLFSTAFDLVQDLVFEVDEETGLSKANGVMIAPLTEDQSNTRGTFAFEGDLFNSETRLQVGGLDATIDLRASNVRIANLDTMGYPVSVLQPMAGLPYELNNSGVFGIVNKPLRFSTRLLISLVGDDNLQVRNEVDIDLDMYTARIFIQALLRIAEQRFRSLPIKSLLDLNCWLSTIPAPPLDERGVRLDGSEIHASLVDLVTSVADIRLNVTCIECSSPELYDLAGFVSSSEAEEEITVVGNDILDYIETLLGGNFVTLQVDRMLNDAPKKCPHLPTYDESFASIEYQSFATEPTESNISFLIAVGATFLALVAMVVILMSIIRCIVRRRHRRWLRTLSSRKVDRILRIQRRERDMEDDLNETTQSMFVSPDIPRWLRWSMPFIILGNVGFFLSGHLSLGATVNIEGRLAGEVFRVEQFFEFSMARSTIDIWNAGGRELAVMIFLLSGLWPYTKQFVTLALWFLPPNRVSISRRGSILIWLDCLAKWSMVDIFVLVISLAAFRVSVQSPDVRFLPSDFYSLDLLVVPLWGLYANMIAQLISQVSSHYIIHYHRRIVDVATKKYKANQQQQIEVMIEVGDCLGGEQSSIPAPSDASVKRTRLSTHAYGRPHRGESEKLVPRRGVDALVLAGTVLLFIFVGVGCALPSFSLELLGLVGLAVESGQGFTEANTKHTVFTIVRLLFEQAEFLDTLGDYVGLGTLSMLLLFSVLVVPLVQATMLVIQWFIPATLRIRWRMAVAIEMLQAWQYCEVYLIAIFVASWQLGPVSEFMINSYCDSLQSTFNELVYYGILKPEDAQCFSVQSKIEYGSYILAVGAIFLALLNTFVMKATTQFFRDQEELERKLLDDEIAVGQGIVKPPITPSDDLSAESDIDVDDDLHEVVRPVPVLFTDTFRWTLRGVPRDQVARTPSLASGRSSTTEEYALVEKDGMCRAQPYGGTNDDDDCSHGVGDRIVDGGKVLVYDTGEDQPQKPIFGFADPSVQGSIIERDGDNENDDMHSRYRQTTDN